MHKKQHDYFSGTRLIQRSENGSSFHIIPHRGMIWKKSNRFWCKQYSLDQSILFASCLIQDNALRLKWAQEVLRESQVYSYHSTDSIVQWVNAHRGNEHVLMWLRCFFTQFPQWKLSPDLKNEILPRLENEIERDLGFELERDEDGVRFPQPCSKVAGCVVHWNLGHIRGLIDGRCKNQSEVLTLSISCRFKREEALLWVV